MDYINFLIAAQQVFSSTEDSRSHPMEEGAAAHDAYTRLLMRLPPDSKRLWQEAEDEHRKSGFPSSSIWFINPPNQFLLL